MSQWQKKSTVAEDLHNLIPSHLLQKNNQPPNSHLENILQDIQAYYQTGLPGRLVCSRAMCSMLQVRLRGWADVTFLRVLVSAGDPYLSCTLLEQQLSHVAGRQTVSNTGSEMSNTHVVTEDPSEMKPTGKPPRRKACTLPLRAACSWLGLNTHPVWVSQTWRVFLAVLLTCRIAWKGEESSCSAGCGWEGVRGCLEQLDELQPLSPGYFQKTEGFALKEKEKKRCAEKSGIWLNLHRYLHRRVRVTLIRTSLRWTESIQPSTKFSLFADFFYLLRVSHSSGVCRRVNLIYYEMPHCGMKCFIHRQDQKVSLNWKAELYLIIFKGERKQKNGKKIIFHRWTGMEVNGLSWLTYSPLCFLGVNIKPTRLPTYHLQDAFNY